MKDCEKYIEMISAMLDGELSAAEESQLHAHLEECEDCRRVYRAFSSLSGAVKDSAAEPPESLAKGIMFKVGLQSQKRSGRRFAYGKFAAVAACAAIVIIASSRVGGIDLFKYSSGESAPEAAISVRAEQESALGAVDFFSAVSDSAEAVEDTLTGAASPGGVPTESTNKGAAVPAVQPEATVFVAEAEAFNVSLMNMTSADIFDSEPALWAKSPLLTVTEEAGLQFLAELLTIYRLQDMPVPEEEPLCVIGVTSGQEHYTVTVWIVDGSIIGRDDSTSTMYLATGDAEDVENLLSLVPAA